MPSILHYNIKSKEFQVQQQDKREVSMNGKSNKFRKLFDNILTYVIITVCLKFNRGKVKKNRGAERDFQGGDFQIAKILPLFGRITGRGSRTDFFERSQCQDESDCVPDSSGSE